MATKKKVTKKKVKAKPYVSKKASPSITRRRTRADYGQKG